MTRPAAVVLLLAAATVLVWWLAMPSDWSVVPTAEPNTYSTPISARQWAAAATGLAALAAAGGYARGVGVALLGVALPAFALFCYRSATADVIGANLWVIGALPAAAVLAAGVGAVAALARLARRGQAHDGHSPS